MLKWKMTNTMNARRRISIQSLLQRNQELIHRIKLRSMNFPDHSIITTNGQERIAKDTATLLDIVRGFTGEKNHVSIRLHEHKNTYLSKSASDQKMYFYDTEPDINNARSSYLMHRNEKYPCCVYFEGLILDESVGSYLPSGKYLRHYNYMLYLHSDFIDEKDIYFEII